MRLESLWVRGKRARTVVPCAGAGPDDEFGRRGCGRVPRGRGARRRRRPRCRSGVEAAFRRREMVEFDRGLRHCARAGRGRIRAWACLRTLLRDSCTMRYRLISSPGSQEAVDGVEVGVDGEGAAVGDAVEEGAEGAGDAEAVEELGAEVVGDLADVLDGVHRELGDLGELLLGGLRVAGVEESEVGAVLDDEEFLFEGIVEVRSDAATFGLLRIDELAGEGFLGRAAAFEGRDAPSMGAGTCEEDKAAEGEREPAALPPVRAEDEFEGGIGDRGDAVVVHGGDAERVPAWGHARVVGDAALAEVDPPAVEVLELAAKREVARGDEGGGSEVEFEEIATRGQFKRRAGFPDLNTGQGAADVRRAVYPFRCGHVPAGLGEILDSDDEVGADAAEDGAFDPWARGDEVPWKMAGVDDRSAAVGGEPEASVAGAHAGGLNGTGELEGAEAVGAVVEIGVEARGAVVGDGMELSLGYGEDAASAREPEAAEPVVDHLVDGGIGESLGGRVVAELTVAIAEQPAVESADPEGAVGFGEEADDDLDGVAVRGGPVGDDLVSADEVEAVGGADPEGSVGGLADGTDVVVGEAVGAGEGGDGKVGADGVKAAVGTHPDVSRFVAGDAPDGDGLPPAVHEERRELAVPVADGTGCAGAEPEGAVGSFVGGEEEVVGESVGGGELLDPGGGDAIESAGGGEPDRAVAALDGRGHLVVGQALGLADGGELGPLELCETEAVGGRPD
jgi:hypothetical protein